MMVTLAQKLDQAQYGRKQVQAQARLLEAGHRRTHLHLTLDNLALAKWTRYRIKSRASGERQLKGARQSLSSKHPRKTSLQPPHSQNRFELIVCHEGPHLNLWRLETLVH